MDESGASEDRSSSGLSAPAQWLLLNGDRRVVAAALLAVLALLLGGLVASDVLAVTDGSAMTRLFSSLVTGNLTLITVVISINQLVLSREFGTPAELEDRIREMIEYRRQVEATADADVSPITPETFLDFLAHQIREEAVELREVATEGEGDRYQAPVEDYATVLVEQSDRISAALERRPGSAFHTLLTILETDFTRDLYGAERLQSAYGESLPAPATDALEDLFELIEYMGVARQYFKTLYMQRELADLSRKILYAGLPAVATSMMTVWLYGRAGGAGLDGAALSAVVVAAAAVALCPPAVLVAYVVRITTVARRTASLMPFRIADESPL